MIHANPAAEDLFEQARQDFFGAKEKIIMASADFLKTQNDNADTTPTASQVFSVHR
jgi:hypothetical protein